jgi:DNA-binding winged helix-turn-helix (wHTH) protein/predicted ATPase
MSRPLFVFPPFRLDPVEERLWQGDRAVPVRPKTFALLRYLVERAGVLVTREELLGAIWPGVHGAEALPKKSVYEARKALGDVPGAPRFVETVARRGWRFIGRVALDAPRAFSGGGPEAPLPWPACFVGRQAELAALHARLERARRGERQVVFVTGELGIGKTALVDAFWRALAGASGLYLARGQCVEHRGPTEAYLPVLEALGRLCREPGGRPVLDVLRRLAPTWLLQMPALVETAEVEALQRRVLGAPQERMLREGAEALETLSAVRPLVLWLEDLQWSDYSTVDLLRCLAQRRGPARLLLIATCRPADVAAGAHPVQAVRRELQARGECAELVLDGLTVTEVGEYLAVRLGPGGSGAEQPREFAQIVHRSTEGHPLFMVVLLDYLAAQGTIESAAGQWAVRGRLEDIASSVPDTLRRLIEAQVDRLEPAEQRVLEAASVAGPVCPALAVAAGLDIPHDRAEACCEALSRRGQLLAALGAEFLPDGTVSGRYGFRHALYQKVLYERVGPARRQQLHRRIGEGLEAALGLRADPLAAELAMHFDRGGDASRAVRYLARAAQLAVRRSANREAIDLLTRGLELARTLPDAGERAARELELQVALAVPLMMTRGYTASEVRVAYERARELCRQIGDTPHLFPVVVGLSRFYYGRSSIARKNASAGELLRLARRSRDPSCLLVAHMMQAGNLFFQGKFARARAHAERGLGHYDPAEHHALVLLYGDDPRILCHCWAALALWYLGYPERALARVTGALHIAGELGYPFGQVFAQFWTAFVHQVRGEPDRVREHADALTALAERHAIPQFAAMGVILQGWALSGPGCAEERIARIRLGMDRLRALGQELGRPYFSALLAEAYRQSGRVADALRVVAEALALAERTGERMHQADLYRLYGELLADVPDGAPRGVGLGARRGPSAARLRAANASLKTALAIARRQGARSLTLRATTSLARLWACQGQARRARRTLAAAYREVREGRNTRDHRAARALLAIPP